MPRRQRRFLYHMTLLWVLVLGVTVAAAETLYVQGRSAVLRDGKTSLDPVVTRLQHGQDLTLLKKEGDWLEVRTEGGKTGWIYRTKVTSTKPEGGGNSLLEAMGKSLREGEASAVTASAGARGLDKTSKAYADRVGITQQHRDEVDRMTGYQIPDQEIEQFLREGRLGEYAQ